MIDGYHKNASNLPYFLSEIALQTILVCFYRSRMKGLSSRALLKISFLADFCHFLKKSLNFILSQPNLVFGFNIVNLVLTNQKIIIIMPCYDFIVKFQNLDSKGLFRPFKKRDEPDIGLNGLK